MNDNALKELAEKFEKLGAKDAELWADAELRENIPQLARFLFLRQAWNKIVADDDTAWIAAEIDWAAANPGRPTAGLGAALKRLLAAGATVEDINEAVRVMPI